MAAALVHETLVAWRTARRSPWFTATAAVVLGIGIGAVTAMLSALYGVALRPLPFPEPERLVWLWARTDTGRLNTVSAPDYYDYRDGCGGFASLAAHRWRGRGVLLTGAGEAERVTAAKVSANLFATLGAEPRLGRSFAADEEQVGGPPVVVVGHALWQRRLGGDAAAVGRPLVLDGTAYQVIGVMGPDFDYPAGSDVWLPMRRGGKEESNRSDNAFRVVGRLGAGVTLEQAGAELGGLARRIAASYPEWRHGWGVELELLQDVFYGDLRRPMLLLTGATFVLLLVACANLSCLLLARVMSRGGELAVRRALGASSWRIVRQILAEGLLVALLGAAVGIAVAWVALRALRAAGPPGLPRLQQVGLDLPVLLVALLVTVAAGLLVGLVPALKGAAGGVAGRLRQGRHTTGGHAALRARGVLVASQTALSLVLLVSAGLLIRSSLRLQRVDPGFRPAGLLTVDLHLPAHRYRLGSEESAVLVGDLLERLRSRPELSGAAVADQLPPFGGPWNGIYRADRPPVTQADRFPATRRFVSDGYFSTLGIPLLAGRDISPGDRLGSPPVMVVSRALAEQLFPGEDALGRRIVYNGAAHEIVGLAADVKDYGLDAASRPVFYLPARQYPASSYRVAVRGSGGTALAEHVRAVVRALERDAVVARVGTMDEWLAGSLAGTRFATLLLGIVSAVALLLAAVGLFGVMAVQITDRAREIGIRVALGARPGRIVVWLVGKGAAMAGTGCLVGLAASLATGRLLDGMLFATSPADAATYAIVVALLVLVILVACLVPARRALRLDAAAVMRDG